MSSDMFLVIEREKFSTLVSRLRDKFSPKDEKMFYQHLMIYKKKPDQTAEDLTQVIDRPWANH